MYNTSQVILRNADRLEKLETLVLNPPADPLLAQLALPLRSLTWDYSAYLALQQYQRNPVDFAVQPSVAGPYGQALIFMSKAQAEFSLLWQLACAHVQPGGSVWIVGEKREGINTAAKRLADAGVKLVKVDSARHCQLWQALVPDNLSAPILEDLYQSFELPWADRNLTICSLPGVFGVGRLDEGTALLLEHLGEVPAGRLLDFGCGAGVIGACLKASQPKADVHLVDIHVMALESARRTLAINELSGEVYASDGLGQVSGKFRAIYTNPPFHTGVKTDYRVTTQMIRDARDRLEKGGELRLVANAFLHYPELIQDVFGNCETLAQTSKFRVLRAVNG